MHMRKFLIFYVFPLLVGVAAYSLVAQAARPKIKPSSSKLKVQVVSWGTDLDAFRRQNLETKKNQDVKPESLSKKALTAFNANAPVGVPEEKPKEIRSMKPGDAELLRSFESKTSIAVGDTNSMQAVFSGLKEGGVTLDLELYASNAKIGQKYVENATVVPGKNITLTLNSPSGLAPGTYTWKASVFTPEWKKVLHWYDPVDSFNVSTTTITTIQLVSIERVKENLANGSSTVISPTFINTGATLANVTLALALYKGSILADQVVYKGQTLAKGVNTAFQFETVPLLLGSYTIEANFKDAGGTTLMNFSNLGTIYVNP